MNPTAAAMLATLQRWRDAGALRALDLAFAHLLHELDPDAPASLLLAGALVAHLEGQGHGCADLQALPELTDELHAWPPDLLAELQALLPSLQAVAASPLIETDPAGSGGSSPLVRHGSRLYLRRYWRHESRIAAAVHARTAAGDGADTPDAAAARLWLARLFPPRKAADGVDWQKAACALALRGRLALVTGGPGTGKTHTAARLLMLLQALHRGPQPLRVALAAPTGKAAARLKQAIDAALQQLRPTLERDLFAHDPTAAPGAARTLHALLGARPGTRRLRHDAANPLEVDLLFVDEASMVHLEMMAALLDALPPRSRLVLLGDKDQLASVEAGAVLGDLCEGADADRYRKDTLQWLQQAAGLRLPARLADERGPPLAQHTAMLRTSHRFDGAIGELAAAVNRGDAAAVAARLPADAAQPVALQADPAALLPLALHGRPGVGAGYAAYLQLLAARPPGAADFDAWAAAVLRSFDRCRVLCALREGPHGVAGLNAAIEQALAEAGLLPQRRGEWYEGRPLMVTRNDPALGVFNGDIGIVLRPPGGGGAPRAYFLDGETLRSVSSARLVAVQTAFALTVHKSQGSEFEHVILVLPDADVPVLTRELVYTALTRARRAFTLAAPQPALLAAAVQRRTRRASGLHALLQQQG